MISREDNEKLITTFGAQRVSDLKEVPDHYAFAKGLVYSHRDLGRFLKSLKAGKRCAIVSGLNASGTLHIGHKAVFDTVLFFQETYGVEVFVPISDDESYVSRKVETQAEAFENSLRLARELLAYGFDPQKTHIIIDQVYTDIYNLAIRYSRKVTLSEIRATYGYTPEDNPGLFFYPAVQSAHVLFPLERGFDDVLVPIGPDEDTHLRICRDIAGRSGLTKPAVMHVTFMPGLDGEKMSKSRGNVIGFLDDEKTLKRKINKAFSGGKDTVEEHREHGGDPEIDMSCFYLDKYFLDAEEKEELFAKYRSGELLSGDVKKRLFEEMSGFLSSFQERIPQVSDEVLVKALVRNEPHPGIEALGK